MNGIERAILPPDPKRQAARLRLSQQTPLAVSSAIKTLLETKHLYQILEVKLDVTTEKMIEHYPDLKSEAVTRLFSDWWGFHELEQPRGDPSALHFPLPTVETFCEARECRKPRPHNPLGFWKAPDFESGFGLTPFEAVKRLQATIEPGAIRFDAFVLSYRCQGCKGVPQVFLVRRYGTRLQLSGRAPIEQVTVPSFIPSRDRDWYSGAIVAYQSGQDLAGLFLLRTFIEQVARRKVKVQPPPSRGSELMDEYMKLVPEEVKSFAPSLRVLYEQISTAMHEADHTKAPFEQTRKQIDTFFEVKDVHRRAKTLPQPATPGTGGTAS